MKSIRSEKNEAGSVRSIHSVKNGNTETGSVTSIRSKRASILDDSIFKTRDVEVEDDNVSVKTLTEEDTEEYIYRSKEDTESAMGDEEKDPETYYNNNGYHEDVGVGATKDDDNISIKSYNVD